MSAIAPRHLEDGALVRLLDGQPDPGDDAAHLRDCQRCADRLAGLRRRSDAFSALLEHTRAAAPAPPPDLWQRALRRRSRWWDGGLARAAAIAALLAAGALAAEPVREWLGAGIGRLVEALRPGGGPAAAPAPAEPGAAVDVSFVPAGDRLVIRIDSEQTGGTLVVRFRERRSARGEILTDDPAASLLVLPDGFRARNRPGDAWSYRFTLPAALREVEVRVGGLAPRVLTPSAGDDLGVPLGG